MTTQAATLSMVQNPAQAAVLLDPLRLKMLERLAEPDSASGLARQLGLPRQKVNYHLRELEKGGFVGLVEERRKGNCIERLYRATARFYVIDPAVLGELGADPEKVQDHFSSAYLVAVAAKTIRDLGVLRMRAEKAGKRLATFTLQTELRFASAGERSAFAEELANEVARLVAKYHNDQAAGGRSFQFFLGGYPALAAKSGKEQNQNMNTEDAETQKAQRKFEARPKH